ncbi:hypothetical protein Lalb_Chr02g0149611 [Lupinus albus]|uniref:Uncharacterized protein n=1 Tax=Lupinus albus TaxID=3870 RepID=A0A6A4QYA1_LUPAL|nr:hypothetical protein Lalb_Chr02g0149611 [Lupinus albus]
MDLVCRMAWGASTGLVGVVVSGKGMYLNLWNSFEWLQLRNVKDRVYFSLHW